MSAIQCFGGIRVRHRLSPVLTELVEACPENQAQTNTLRPAQGERNASRFLRFPISAQAELVEASAENHARTNTTIRQALRERRRKKYNLTMPAPIQNLPSAIEKWPFAPIQ